MYIPIPSQPDCLSAWREATRAVGAGHEASNVIIDIADPTGRATIEDPGVQAVDAFLRSKGKKAVETVANTIFPAALHRRYGAPDFYDRFMNFVLPKVRGTKRWSGYYFERMIELPVVGSDKSVNQLEEIIDRLRNPQVKAHNKFEISIFDPTRDVDKSPYGGQCLSFGSFKRRKAKGGDYLDLTVLYRNHFYIEKLLGNLIGLGRLLKFVADSAGLKVGSLTVVSTHAKVDMPKGAKKADIDALLAACD